ncbi:hypothetical protein, partial [Leptospira congkakensis]|uniref:hypothetical protein n=1 Tax=Leptospira congkakensis TaxID=2484932 RepID=UPI001AEFCBB5
LLLYLESYMKSDVLNLLSEINGEYQIGADSAVVIEWNFYSHNKYEAPKSFCIRNIKTKLDFLHWA